MESVFFFLEPEQECPKTWFQTKDKKCLKIYDPSVKLSLEESQLHCNYAQSNLASFDSQDQINEFLSINFYLFLRTPQV